MTDEIAEAAALLAACNKAQARYFWGYLSGLLEGQVGRDKAATLLVEAKAALAVAVDESRRQEFSNAGPKDEQLEQAQQFDELAKRLAGMDVTRRNDILTAARVLLTDEHGRKNACEMVALGERLLSLADRDVTHG